jgi:hypothetical protein
MVVGAALLGRRPPHFCSGIHRCSVDDRFPGNTRRQRLKAGTNGDRSSLRGRLTVFVHQEYPDSVAGIEGTGVDHKSGGFTRPLDRNLDFPMGTGGPVDVVADFNTRLGCVDVQLVPVHF